MLAYNWKKIHLQNKLQIPADAACRNQKFVVHFNSRLLNNFTLRCICAGIWTMTFMQNGIQSNLKWLRMLNDKKNENGKIPGCESKNAIISG